MAKRAEVIRYEASVLSLDLKQQLYQFVDRLIGRLNNTDGLGPQVDHPFPLFEVVRRRLQLTLGGCQLFGVRDGWQWHPCRQNGGLFDLLDVVVQPCVGFGDLDVGVLGPRDGKGAKDLPSVV